MNVTVTLLHINNNDDDDDDNDDDDVQDDEKDWELVTEVLYYCSTHTLDK